MNITPHSNISHGCHSKIVMDKKPYSIFLLLARIRLLPIRNLIILYELSKLVTLFPIE